MHNSKEQQSHILALLRRHNFLAEDHLGQMELLAGDGSDRIFYRVTVSGEKSLIAVFPSPSLPKGLAEQTAAFRIGVHLFDKGVAVPEVVGFDKEHGLLLFEDMGNTHLHSLVSSTGKSSEGSSRSFGEIEPLYRQAIDCLIRFQLEGCIEFDTRFCWDTPNYDEKLMLERESDYFNQAFCRDYMGKIPDDPRLLTEFHKLARRSAQEPADYLLHRDYQSRNLMVHNNRVRIIDFQGSRLGPLGYDLASLLLDPYAGLASESRQILFTYYVQEVSKKISFDIKQFLEGYYCLALQRNLQILGAFAFLTQVKGKIFFEQFLVPASNSLLELLHNPQGIELPVLTALMEELSEELVKSQLLRIEN